MRAQTPTSPALADASGAALDIDSIPGDYDALAELFLGESKRSSAPAPRVAAGLGKRVAHPAELTAARADRHVEPPAAPFPESRPLAHASGTSLASPAGIVEIEALVMGHLPVIAAAWATQYAAAVAEYEHQPVALLRLASGWASIELFGDECGAPSSVNGFEQALDDAAARCRRWILRVDAVDELGAVRAAGVRSVTLLCGADEAAVVAGYRTIKSISASKSGEAIEMEAGSPSLRVAIMGAGGEQAAHAAAKLQEASAAFLDRPLEAVAPVERIAPVRPIRLFQGVIGMTSEAWLARVANAANHALEAGSRRMERGPSTADGGVPRASGAQVTARSQDAPALADPGSAAFSRQISAKTAFPSGSEALLSDVLLRAAPAAPRGPGAALSEMIPGLQLLPVRCPYDESVELASGPEGALEVLAHAGDRSLESLTIVADWAKAHHKLLTLACPSLRMDGMRAPVRRVFTESAPGVRRLLDSDVRIHLLTRVSASGLDVWVCSDLN